MCARYSLPFVLRTAPAIKLLMMPLDKEASYRSAVVLANRPTMVSDVGGAACCCRFTIPSLDATFVWLMRTALRDKQCQAWSTRTQQLAAYTNPEFKD